MFYSKIFPIYTIPYTSSKLFLVLANFQRERREGELLNMHAKILHVYARETDSK